MEESFKFEVGSIYENMKGNYEVVSIRKNAMVIRWVDGSEVTLTPLEMKLLWTLYERRGRVQSRGRSCQLEEGS